MDLSESIADIEIEIETQYLDDESKPTENRFVFAYTITITNHGSESIQLTDRYWRITDANDKVQEVRGKGVVGKQPHIPSGDSFRYTSGAMIETAVGTMEGHYGMLTHAGRVFNAPIPAFTLADPGSLH